MSEPPISGCFFLAGEPLNDELLLEWPWPSIPMGPIAEWKYQSPAIASKRGRGALRISGTRVEQGEPEGELLRFLFYFAPLLSRVILRISLYGLTWRPLRSPLLFINAVRGCLHIRQEMADWGPVVVAVLLFVLLSPGLLFQLPGKGRVVEFVNMKTSGISILVHAVIFFGILTILLIVVGVHIYTG
ncbi:hypothetical protein BHE74_00027713 [Ensete ventricosum]|nr:hypothetical protein BHE74_00027713 [Ensete ventricosum]